MKALAFLFLICFGWTNNLYAQADTPKTTQQHRAELVQHQDELLEFLLQIPFEQRQYIFPMLSEKRSIPKKIKTHPDVLVWKGKRPTRIAKRFQNDPELLEFLPAQFYYFLAPEMWPDGDTPSLENNPNKLFIKFMQGSSSEEVAFAPDELIQLKNGLTILYDSLSEEQKESLKTTETIYLSQMILFNSPTLTEKLKKQGYDSPRDFAQTVDKIAKAYRQYKKGQTPENSYEQKLVKDYFSLIPFIFKKSGFEVLLNVKAYSD